MPHIRDPSFELWSGAFSPTIPYYTEGTWEEPWSGRNRFPLHRLFLLQAEGEISSHMVHHRGGEDQRMALKAGRSYLMPAGLDLSFHFQSGLQLLAIHFQFPTPLPYPIMGDEIQVREMDAPPPDFFKKVGGTLSGLLRLRASWEWLLASHLDCSLEDLKQQRQLEQRWVRLHRLLESPIDANTSVSFLARKFGESPNALSKRFIREHGFSLKGWIDQKLFARATELLLGERQRVREASMALAFSSEFQFSRFFKRLSGQSPKAFLDSQALSSSDG